MNQLFRVLPLVIVGLLLAVRPARAENEGQADLDKATEAKVTAESPDDLADVIRLCRSALTAGLDESNTKFANSLLVGTFVQRAEIVCATIFDRRSPPPSWRQYRTMALGDLEAALEIDPDQADAYYMVARLQILPGDDPENRRKKAQEAVDAAIRLSKHNPSGKAKALLLRAGLSADPASRHADLDEAVKMAPEFPDVYRARASDFLMAGKIDEAVADFDMAIKLDPKNPDSYQARGLIALAQKKFPEARTFFDKAIELAPQAPMPYMHRARLNALESDMVMAMADINRASQLDPRSPNVLLLRAMLYRQQNLPEKALADVEEVLRLQPGLPEALQLHAALTAGAGKLNLAIQDLEQLKIAAPDNDELLLQLGIIYSADKQRQKALDSFTSIIARDPKNWLALRSRADVYLLLGKQVEAIADYESALKANPDDSGLLNNLAWVLATSPDDKLRNGARSIELAKKACDETKYEQAHILSTLAAAYAETGDFDTAIKWSSEAVKLGKEGIKEQLAKELESYQAKKPWHKKELPDDPLPVGDDDDAPPSADKKETKTTDEDSAEK